MFSLTKCLHFLINAEFGSQYAASSRGTHTHMHIGSLRQTFSWSRKCKHAHPEEWLLGPVERWISTIPSSKSMNTKSIESIVRVYT